VIKLWNVMFAVAAFSLEQFEDAAIFTTRVGRVQTSQIAIHRPPANSMFIPLLSQICFGSADFRQKHAPRKFETNTCTQSTPISLHIKIKVTGNLSERYLPYGITHCYLPPEKGERVPP